MLQNLTKPPEGETAGESVQIALAASAPNDGTTASPIHTPAGSRQGSDEPAAAGAAAMPEAPLEGNRPRCRRRPGHAAALLVRRLAGPAARAAGEWWIARRLACIFDVGVTVPV